MTERRKEVSAKINRHRRRIGGLSGRLYSTSGIGMGSFGVTTVLR